MSAMIAGLSVTGAALAQQVVVQGNQRVDSETIRSYVTEGGSPEEIRQNLLATGMFSNVSVSRQGSRQTATEEDILDRHLPDEPAPEQQVVLDDENARLWDCLKQLPERCQRLLRIVAAAPRPDYTAIASDLGMPVGSIGPTRGRCLEKLRVELVRTGGLA